MFFVIIQMIFPPFIKSKFLKKYFWENFCLRMPYYRLELFVENWELDAFLTKNAYKSYLVILLTKIREKVRILQIKTRWSSKGPIASVSDSNPVSLVEQGYSRKGLNLKLLNLHQFQRRWNIKFFDLEWPWMTSNQM